MSTAAKQVRTTSKKSGGNPGGGDADRGHMIAEAAYYLAQQRGFSGGDPLHDWLEAERMIDARSAGTRKRKRHA